LVGLDDLDNLLGCPCGPAQDEAIHAQRSPGAGPRARAVVRSGRQLVQLATLAEHDGVASGAGRWEGEGMGRTINQDTSGFVFLERMRPAAARRCGALIHLAHAWCLATRRADIAGPALGGRGTPK